MATSEEIKNALIGQLATFNGSSTEAEAMASENIGKIYVPTDEDVIIINKRRVGCGRNATTEKDGLMSVNDKKNLDYMTVHLDGIDKTLAGIPNTYATKEEVEADFTAVNNSLAIASSTATDALGKANDAKGKVDNIISGTTVVPTATNAQEAQKATQDGSGNEITKTYATKAELKTTNDSLGTTAATANDAKSKVDKIISGETKAGKATHADTATTAKNLEDAPYLQDGDNNSIKLNVGGKTSNSYIVPYATTADKATKDGSGNNIVNTYATKEELNSKLNASDAMVLAGTISGTGVIQSHNDNVVTQNVKNGTTNISALTDYKAGWTWRVASNGTISGIGKVESGDMVMCISDYKSAYSANDWSAIQRNIDLATANSSGLMSATDKANLDAALIQLDGIDTKINNIEGDITNINNDLTNNYATKTEMGAVEDKADAAQSTANEAKSKANSLVNGTTKAKKAETADSATKATQDGNGKVISDTYALRGEAVSTADLGKYVPVNKHNGGVLAFPIATQSAGGAMSSDDKKKLDDTEGTYYSSFNVTGSGWYRLVNIPKNIYNLPWKDRNILVNLINTQGNPTSASFKVQYNTQFNYVIPSTNSFICQPLTYTNSKCVDKVRLVYLEGASNPSYIDVYVILPQGTTNIKVEIKSNIHSQYLAKNPVGEDGKEGVAEAVLIALPDGYKSIERNAWVGTTTTGCVVGGLYSERALQDINGNRIDEQYATKDVATTSADGLMSTDMVRKIDNIQLTSNNDTPIIQMHQEDGSNQFLIPYMQNDMAYPIARGGYIKVVIDGVEQTGITDAICNGMPDFISTPFLNLTKDSVITIEIDSNKSFGSGNYAFISFSSNWARPKGIKLEYKLNETDEWTTASETDNNTKACYATFLYKEAYFFRYLKYTITKCPASSLRITEIGVASYSSQGLDNIVLSKGGGEMYGNIAPYKDNKQYLGSVSKAWYGVNAYNLLIKKADGNRIQICSYDNNMVVYTKEGDNTKAFVFDEANYSFRRGYNAPDMILGTSVYPWKNVYGKQLTSTVTDGTAPLVVSSKTMVANLNAQYARMLFSSSNAPVNAGNALRPVYFNGGIPVACDMSASGNRWGVLPFVDGSGNFHIGKSVSFNKADANTSSDVTITARGADDADGAGLTLGGNTIASGKFAQYSGYICSNTADLTSYWGKLWSTKWNTKQDDLDVTIYIHSSYMSKSGIVHVRCRFESTKNEDGTYTEGSHGIYIRQIVGNLTSSSFRLYYKCDVNASTGGITNGQIELWCNVDSRYGVYNAVLLSATSRVYKEHTNYYGTFSQTTFTTVQTPALPNYVEMTNVTISQTAAKAQAADKAYNADNAVYLQTTNVSYNNKDFPILWSGSETLNTEQVNSNVYRSYNDLSYNPSKKRITTGLFKGCLDSVAVPSADNYCLQYFSGNTTIGDSAGNAKEGSYGDYNLWSYPKGGTYIDKNSNLANIQTLRLKFTDKYFHDLFMSPNYPGLWHRWVNNGTAKDWKKIVEATEDGKVIIEGTTQEDTLRIKNKDRSTGEIHIFNGEQGNAVIRHYEGSTPTDLKFNSTQVMHGSKILAYANDVTALQTEIANLKKTVQEQATLIEALQSALTWE